MKDVPRCFWDRFDMILTRIYETQPHVADFSQTRFCLGFYKCFLEIDELALLFETIFLCDLGILEEFLQCGVVKLRCVRCSKTVSHFTAIWALRCETAIRIVRFAMRGAKQLSSLDSSDTSKPRDCCPPMNISPTPSSFLRVDVNMLRR